MITQIATHSPLRNFTYLLSHENEAYLVDPWDGEALTTYLEKHELELKGVINTHEHFDHVRGNQFLVERYKVPVFGHKEIGSPGLSHFLKEGDELELSPDSCLKVMETPGHTVSHLCFQLLIEEEVVGVLTGDTVFNAGVGNCHNGGDPEVLFETIESRFSQFKDETKLYPGHDYLENNLRFTLEHEPSNAQAQKMLENLRPDMVTNFKQEREINTFFRLESQALQQNLRLENSARKEVFLKLRSLRNHW